MMSGYTSLSDLVQGDIEELLEREWLITNNLGGYSSSTVINCNTRKYHGVLVASTLPPVGRIVTVSNFLEVVVSEGREIALSNFEFNNVIHPQGFRWLSSLSRENTDELTNISFVYKVEDITFIKTIWLFAEHNVAFVYWLVISENPSKQIKLKIQPLLAMRDFHSLRRKTATDPFKLEIKQNRLHITVPTLGKDRINKFYRVNLIPSGLRSPVDVRFVEARDWWYNFKYRKEAERGYDCGEDLYTPGFFELDFIGKGGFGLWIDAENLTNRKLSGLLNKINAHLHSGNKLEIVKESEIVIDELTSIENPLKEPIIKTLTISADQFLVKRRIKNKNYTSIIAGFHWFADWARDAFISMEGLLLDRKKFKEARESILLFNSVIKDGLIPNCFDDYSSTPLYNSIDATLWFIYATDLYIDASSDVELWKKYIQKSAIDIFEHFSNGTIFDIKVDASDGLLSAGNKNTQLTWMDAKWDNVAFTPRYGKAVEVNALWYNFLKILHKRLDGRKKKLKTELEELIKLTEQSFKEKFWFDEGKYLYDCIRKDFKDKSIRPNQIFAVSLKESPLELYQQEAVVNCVRRNLLTPFGLRTLAPSDPNYKGRYEGGIFDRDSAYHQGTVWPWLMGHFIEAYLKVNDYSLSSASVALEWLKPILTKHLYEAGIGTISEIFDGDEPHRPRGCIGQAWSVGQIYHSIIQINKIFTQSAVSVG